MHRIGDSFSLTPRLTVTSHQDVNGNTVWYLGGEIAESGVGKSETEQITAAQYAISREFPWLDCSSAEWRCFTINRSEANINDNHRPDDAYFCEKEYTGCLAYQADPDACAGRANFTKSDGG